MRRLLFTALSLGVLAVAVASSPTAARAQHCNDSWCDRYAGLGCMENFPGTHCLGSGGSCNDEICPE